MSVRKVICPKCGNDNVERMQLRIELPTYLFRYLYRDNNGSVYAEEEIAYVVDSTDPTCSSIYCLQCGEDFGNPGVVIQ